MSARPSAQLPILPLPTASVVDRSSHSRTASNPAPRAPTLPLHSHHSRSNTVDNVNTSAWAGSPLSVSTFAAKRRPVRLKLQTSNLGAVSTPLSVAKPLKATIFATQSPFQDTAPVSALEPVETLLLSQHQASPQAMLRRAESADEIPARSNVRPAELRLDRRRSRSVGANDRLPPPVNYQPRPTTHASSATRPSAVTESANSVASITSGQCPDAPGARLASQAIPVSRAFISVPLPWAPVSASSLQCSLSPLDYATYIRAQARSQPSRDTWLLSPSILHNALAESARLAVELARLREKYEHLTRARDALSRQLERSLVKGELQEEIRGEAKAEPGLALVHSLQGLSKLTAKCDRVARQVYICNDQVRQIEIQLAEHRACCLRVALDRNLSERQEQQERCSQSSRSEPRVKHEQYETNAAQRTINEQRDTESSEQSENGQKVAELKQQEEKRLAHVPRTKQAPSILGDEEKREIVDEEKRQRTPSTSSNATGQSDGSAFDHHDDDDNDDDDDDEYSSSRPSIVVLRPLSPGPPGPSGLGRSVLVDGVDGRRTSTATIISMDRLGFPVPPNRHSSFLGVSVLCTRPCASSSSATGTSTSTSIATVRDRDSTATDRERDNAEPKTRCGPSTRCSRSFSTGSSLETGFGGGVRQYTPGLLQVSIESAASTSPGSARTAISSGHDEILIYPPEHRRSWSLPILNFSDSLPHSPWKTYHAPSGYSTMVTATTTTAINSTVQQTGHASDRSGTRTEDMPGSLLSPIDLGGQGKTAPLVIRYTQPLKTQSMAVRRRKSTQTTRHAKRGRESQLETPESILLSLATAEIWTKIAPVTRHVD